MAVLDRHFSLRNMAPPNTKTNAASGSLSSIEKKLDKMFGLMDDLSKSQQYLSNNHDDMMTEIKQINADFQRTKGELKTVQNQYKKMAADIEDLKAKVNNGECDKLKGQVMIRGTPEGEDPRKVISKIAKIVQVDVKNDIAAAVWVKKAIQATFSNEDKKRAFIKAAKSKRISTTMYGSNGDEKPIYIDEALTKHTYNLLSEAKKLKKYGVKFIWTSNGDVLMREKENDKVVKIRSEQHIDEIRKQLTHNENKQKRRCDTEQTKRPNKRARNGKASDDADAHSDGESTERDERLDKRARNGKKATADEADSDGETTQRAKRHDKRAHNVKVAAVNDEATDEGELSEF